MLDKLMSPGERKGFLSIKLEGLEKKNKQLNEDCEYI